MPIATPEDADTEGDGLPGTEQSEHHRDLDMGGLGRWEITQSTADTSGEFLEIRWDIESVPKEGPIVHTHPHAEEHYEVVAGVLEVYQDGEWMEVSAGEKHIVPRGVPHTFQNMAPVTVMNVHEPALGMEEYFRRGHRLINEQGVSMPPAGFRDRVLFAMLTMDHAEDIYPVSPPPLVFKGLSALGRVLGYDLPD